MSVVYSPHELANNRYPQPGDHDKAADLLIQGISEMAYEPAYFAPITGALVFGSVASGTAHRRSDLDFFVRIAHGPTSTVEETIEYVEVLMADVDHQTGVQPQMGAHLESSLETDDMLIADDPFLTHCISRAAMGRYSWGDPAKELTSLEDMPHQTLMDQAAGRTMGFLAAQRDYYAPHNGDLTILAAAFDLPGSFGRHLQRLRSLEQEDGEYLAGKLDDKRQGEQFLLTEAGQIGGTLHDEASQLVGMNNVCTQITEAVIKGDIPPEEYGKWLADVMPRGIKSAHSLAKTAGYLMAMRSVGVLD